MACWDSRKTIRGTAIVCGLSERDCLQSLQEIKPGMIELMKPKLSFAQSEIQDGDVICFQIDLPEKE